MLHFNFKSGKITENILTYFYTSIAKFWRYTLEKLTIKDIALMVNVSTATISNYLNGNYSKMSKKTRQKIEETIRDNNYIPSVTAHDLATSDSKTIGVSIADITNPFTSSVLSGIYNACGKLGYTVIFTNANSDLLQEVESINKLKHQGVSGLIVEPVDAHNPIFKTLGNENAVMIDREAQDIKIDTLVTDNFESVKKMVMMMLDKGYEEIYFITWPMDRVSVRSIRYQGFLEATGYTNNDHCIEISEHNAETDVLKEKLSEIMSESKNKRIGFFSMNGKVLISFIREMGLIGKHYPIDFGVASYEDLEWMGIMWPGISCIRQNSFEIGRKSVEILISKLNLEKNSGARRIVIPTEQVVRDSF